MEREHEWGRGREREGGREGGRERERMRIPSRLCTVSGEPVSCLDLRNREIIT